MKLADFLSTDEGKLVSQAEWARRIKVTRGYLCQLRDGNKTPSIDVAYRIERVTGGKVKMCDWVTQSEDKDGRGDDTGLRGEAAETL